MISGIRWWQPKGKRGRKKKKTFFSGKYLFDSSCGTIVYISNPDKRFNEFDSLTFKANWFVRYYFENDIDYSIFWDLCWLWANRLMNDKRLVLVLVELRSRDKIKNWSERRYMISMFRTLRSIEFSYIMEEKEAELQPKWEDPFPLWMGKYHSLPPIKYSVILGFRVEKGFGKKTVGSEIEYCFGIEELFDKGFMYTCTVAKSPSNVADFMSFTSGYSMYTRPNHLIISYSKRFTALREEMMFLISSVQFYINYPFSFVWKHFDRDGVLSTDRVNNVILKAIERKDEDLVFFGFRGTPRWIKKFMEVKKNSFKGIFYDTILTSEDKVLDLVSEEWHLERPPTLEECEGGFSELPPKDGGGVVCMIDNEEFMLDKKKD